MFPHFADEREHGQAVLCFRRILETFAAVKDRRYKGK